ncbi:MAG: SymE family type I addiction module toxin [Limnobaculum xujianqingii]
MSKGVVVITINPQLKISGKWLEKLGLTPGRTVPVTTEQGRMVIEAVINI